MASTLSSNYFVPVLCVNELNAIIFFYRIIVKLYRPMVLEKGQRFTFRNPGSTFATGIVTNILSNLTEEERVAMADGKKSMIKYETKLAEKLEKERIAAEKSASG